VSKKSPKESSAADDAVLRLPPLRAGVYLLLTDDTLDEFLGVLLVGGVFVRLVGVFAVVVVVFLALVVPPILFLLFLRGEKAPLARRDT